MGELQVLIQDLDAALKSKDKAKIYDDILLRASHYFINALEKTEIPFRAPNAIQIILDSETVPPELKSILQGDNARHLQMLSLLIDFCENNRGNNYNAQAAKLFIHNEEAAFKQYTLNAALQTFLREKLWNKHIKIDDMRFLSPNPTAHTQSVTGKAKKKSKIYAPFKTGFWQIMNAAHLKNDIESDTIQLTSQQKKQFKVRSEDGVLTRGYQDLKEGHYLYAVTPKGSLYIIMDAEKVINNVTKHHSTPRAGQPVLSAGHIDIKQDPETQQMRIVSIGRNSGHYGTETRNLLLTALWLNEQKIIDDKCELNGINDYDNAADKATVSQLLTEDRFTQIRADYAQAKLEAERLTPERLDLIAQLQEYIRVRTDALNDRTQGGKTTFWLNTRNKNRDLNVAVAEKLLFKLQDTSFTSDKILEDVIKPKMGRGFTAYVASNSRNITADNITNANATNANKTFAISGELPNIIRGIKTLASAENRASAKKAAMLKQ